jgi:hypothetical protein
MPRSATPIGLYYPDATDPQIPAAVAVVMPTVLRPCIETALDSIYRQTFAGRIQLMIGVDRAAGDRRHLESVLARRPQNVSAIVLELPYSTSTRHGGLHPAEDGGSLRSILSFMANTYYVAFLDDDNAWEPEHLTGVIGAVAGKVWAYSQRMLIDERTGEELGADRWDSVGPDAGRFKDQGGMVDPNCLIVDRVAVARILGRWSEGPGVESDRSFFLAMKNAPHGRVEAASVRYGIRPTNILNKLMRDGTRFDD